MLGGTDTIGQLARAISSPTRRSGVRENIFVRHPMKNRVQPVTPSCV